MVVQPNPVGQAERVGCGVAQRMGTAGHPPASVRVAQRAGFLQRLAALPGAARIKPGHVVGSRAAHQKTTAWSCADVATAAGKLRLLARPAGCGSPKPPTPARPAATARRLVLGLQGNPHAPGHRVPRQVPDAQARIVQPPLAQHLAGVAIQRHQGCVHAVQLAFGAPGLGLGRNAANGHQLRQGGIANRR